MREPKWRAGSLWCCAFFQAHPTEGCAGGFQGMAQASNDNLCELSLDLILGLPGETESSSNGVDLRRISRETILS